ncbi:SRPBCC domain-containing protein [Leptospira selangorensis]|uniref:SRPBCC domain-containing protein n=1 Tax=Leptospira selangorensis TaxID=2484982 RepID=A0A5F2C2N2_9LEPT|nr:SRPBCC family protein [Leptospira selangorensis]TGM13517.1 SRPBCC domain-containing protein [Leptospira selangorensis]TGM22142.1 SRPBCC domain-containing protein [Leptospira selangorensis]
MTNQVVKIEKRINAEPIRLFKAWLKAEEFSSWFLPGNSIGIESAILDPRPGGRFKINMLHEGKVLPHEGEYQIIEEPKKLVFTWRSHATGGLDTLVTVTFDPLEEGSSNSNKKPQTLITLMHERLIGEDAATSHKAGWTSILDSLEKWQVGKK